MHQVLYKIFKNSKSSVKKNNQIQYTGTYKYKLSLKNRQIYGML